MYYTIQYPTISYQALLMETRERFISDFGSSPTSLIENPNKNGHRLLYYENSLNTVSSE
jgi:hypothetical protein